MYCREAPRQQLTNLGSNEDVLAHPCHEYVLDQLQCGVSPDALVQVLRQEYLVKTTRSRLVAYRKFEESRGPYWTLELLELQHWEKLYDLVPVRANGEGIRMRSQDQRLRDIRTRFCEHADTAEENVPLRVLAAFYSKHSDQAALPSQYPGSTVLKNTLPLHLIEVYCSILRGRTLPALGSRCIAVYGHSTALKVLSSYSKSIIFLNCIRSICIFSLSMKSVIFHF